MSCHDVRQAYAAFRARGLALTEWVPIEAHVVRCEECRRALDQVFHAVPADTTARMLRRGKSRKVYGLAAAVVMTVLIAGAGGYAYRETRLSQIVTVPREAPATPMSPAPSSSPAPEGERIVVAREPAPPVASDRGGGSAAPAQAPPPKREDRTAALAKPAPPGGTDVVVQLSTRDRTGAERDLSSLVARMGGANVPRGRDATLRATVPRSRYREFTRGLGQIGSWEVERRSATLPDPVRVAVRLASR